MNIIQEVLREHSKAMRDRVVRYVGKSPARFAELVSVFLKGPYRVTQRAAWPLSYCVEVHPQLIKPHLRKIILNLKTPGLHHAVKRNTLRLLLFVDIPKSLQGIVTDFCFNFFSDPNESIAVKVFSMSVLAKIARRQPDIGRELRLVIEDQLPYAGPALLSRARKLVMGNHLTRE